jgi:hypothetical protein
VPIIVKTIGSAGGRDYSSLAAWAASLPADLVADGNSYRGECYNDSEFTGSATLLTLSGHTTDPSYTITLTTGPGQSFRDNANVQTNALGYNVSNGVGITSSVAYVAGVFSISDANVFLKNLQIKNSGSNGVAISAGSVAVTIDDCIAVSGRTGTYAPLYLGGGSTVRNSLAVQSASGGAAAVYKDSGSSTLSLYFCTLVAPSDITAGTQGIYSQYGSTTVENCAIFGFSAVKAGSSAFSFTVCMTDVASPPSGVTGGKTYANQFQNTTAAAADFRAKTGADLQGAGTADVTNGATDIVGTARPQSAKWDIGCWELLASGVVVTVEAWVPIEHLPMQRGDWASGVEFVGSRRIDIGLPLEAMTIQRADRYTTLEGLVLQGSRIGLPVEVTGWVANDTAGCGESLAQTFVSRRLTSELLRLLLREVAAGGEFATAVSCDAPGQAEWLRAIGALLTADSILPVEWSALPRPMRVSLERLLASPGKRRLLGTPGHMRLLTRL